MADNYWPNMQKMKSLVSRKAIMQIPHSTRREYNIATETQLNISLHERLLHKIH